MEVHAAPAAKRMTITSANPSARCAPLVTSETERTGSALPRDLDRAATLEITVLAGGPGVEREVSLCSGAAVCEALGQIGHRVAMCDIGPGDLSALDRTTDIVFIALHGEFGEDGTIQAQLEARGLRYTGSGPAASRLAMDKAASKRRFREARIPTPAFEVVDRSTLSEVRARFPLPAVVKPLQSGSSVDVTISRTSAALERAVASLCDRYGQALVEQYISGPELTVAVLDNTALPVCEIRTPREFYDYQAKYIDDGTQYLLDVDLPDPLLRRVQALSVAAHRALGCSVFSRSDWMVDRRTLEPFLLEVNTIPGFTHHSLFPKAAAKAGLNFARFCQKIVNLSLREARGV